MLQPLKFGVSAVTADGRDVGTLFRAVIDQAATPEGPTYVVTAVTVQRRLIESGNLFKPGGWDSPRDLLVAMADVTGADEDEVRMALTEEEFLALPPYIIGDVPEPDGDWTPPPGFTAEDVTMRVSALFSGGVYEPPHDEQENRRPTARHLGHGAAVWQYEPHRHIGAIDGVLMDDVSNGVVGLVVRQGVLFAHDVVVPARYIVDLLDDLVHVDIPAAEHDALQEYRPDGTS